MFVIVDKKTKCKVRQSIHHNEYFKTRSAANAGRTRYAKAKNVQVDDYHVLTGDEYRAQVPMKRVQNLMSREWIEIPADTPASCDPSCETYWSM